jgi:hypothetical protein
MGGCIVPEVVTCLLAALRLDRPVRHYSIAIPASFRSPAGFECRLYLKKYNMLLSKLTSSFLSSAEAVHFDSNHIGGLTLA